MSIRQTERQKRRPKAVFRPNTEVVMHRKNPWIVLWWSCALPGFGQIKTGNYLKGFLMTLGEIVINIKANINIAILYTFTGRFEDAKHILDKRLALIYCTIFVFAAFESYRITVEQNKLCILAEHEKSTPDTMAFSTVENNFIDKRVPWTVASWSFLMPGLGHILGNRVITGYFLAISYSIIIYLSNLLPVLHNNFYGHFSQIHDLNPEFLLFIPSFLLFSVFESYVITVENNRLFNEEQTAFFKKYYQCKNFSIPKRGI